MAVANTWNFQENKAKTLYYSTIQMSICLILYIEKTFSDSCNNTLISEVQDLTTINLIKTNFFLLIS